MDNQYLRIYLNDHLAGSVVGLDLARRAADHNKDNDFGEPLTRIADEIEEDRDSLVQLMEALDVPQNRVKQAMAWVTEKALRLKMNGQIVGYSPASRLIEIETLMLGVSGKLGLWRALEASGVDAPGLELQDLIVRAIAQRDELERIRIEAATEAIGGKPRTAVPVGA